MSKLLKKLRRGSSNSYAAMKEMVWEAFLKEWDQYAGLELDLQKETSIYRRFQGRGYCLLWETSATI